MTNKLCPSCGSNKISSSEENKTISLKGGQRVSYLELTDHCQNCGEEGDFSAVNDERVTLAIKALEKECVSTILDSISGKGVKMAYMERALSLPQRTLSRWKANDEVSAAGIALIKMIRVFPWLLDVADHNYNQDYASQKLVSESFQVISRSMQSAGHSIQVSIAPNAKGAFFAGNYTINGESEVVSDSKNILDAGVTIYEQPYLKTGTG